MLVVAFSACQFPDLPEIVDGNSNGDAAVDAFALSAPNRAWVRVNASIEIPVSVERDDGFAGAITVTVPSPPDGIVVTPATISAGSLGTTVTVAAIGRDGAVPGAQPVLNIVASANGIERTAAVTVLVAGVPGAFDESFGTGGIALSGGPGYATTSFVTDAQTVLAAQYSHEVRRLNFDGSLDVTFGASGVLAPTFDESYERPYPLAVGLSTGRVLVAALADGDETATVRRDLFVARYTSNGQPDLTYEARRHLFGSASGASLNAIVRSESDEVFVCGGKSDGDAFLIKLRADGTLDTAFATQGVFTFSTSSNDTCYALATAPSGQIVALIASSPSIGFTDMALVKLTAGGVPDAGFGIDGVFNVNAATPGTPTRVTGQGVDVAPGGSIVVWGQIAEGTTFSTGAAAIWRITPVGTLDSTFNQDGIWRYGDGNGHQISALTSADDGGYIAAGTTTNSNGTPTGLAVWRFDDRGLPDPAWGGEAGLQSTLIFSVDGRAHLLPTDRRVVVTGGNTTGVGISGAVRVWY